MYWRAVSNELAQLNVIHDDISVGIVVHIDAQGFGKIFPGTVEIVNHLNKRRRSICGTKWHNCVSPLDGVGPLECQFLLQFG